MNALSIRDLCISFGDKHILKNINLEIPQGQFVAIVGPSGCGKSTLLKAISGKHQPTSGNIFAGDEEIRQPSRNVGTVEQNYEIFDFLNVLDNVCFGLKLDQTNLPFRFLRRLSWTKLRKQHREKGREILKKVRLIDVENSYPTSLSGGMRQRVAIAQALIMEPKVLLLDEPFSALDESTRESLRRMLVQLRKENQNLKNPYTVVIVTHELNEAFRVADRIVGLSQHHQDATIGSKVVYDQPSPVYHPNNADEFLALKTQRDELRKAIFDDVALQKHQEYVSYWEQEQNAPYLEAKEFNDRYEVSKLIEEFFSQEASEEE